LTDDLDPSLDLYIKAALGKKALDPVVFDVRKLTSVADVFIICSGRSNRQVIAIAEFIQEDLKKHGIRPLSSEGMTDGHWILLDYGHVIFHIFYEPIRKIYDLEGLWVDAKRVKIENLIPFSNAAEMKAESYEDE